MEKDRKVIKVIIHPAVSRSLPLLLFFLLFSAAEEKSRRRSLKSHFSFPVLANVGPSLSLLPGRRFIDAVHMTGYLKHVGLGGARLHL